MPESVVDEAAKAEAVRAAIVDAAEKRFAEFGYTKTTLNEIATQAGMSAANLYRFYENKLDIAAAVVRRMLQLREEALRGALTGQNQDLESQLQAYVLTALRFDRDLDAEQPQLARMLEKIQEERKELATQHRKARQEMLVGLLQAAIAREEMPQLEAGQIAQALRAALILFETPTLHRQYPQAELERLALQVVALLANGILENGNV